MMIEPKERDSGVSGFVREDTALSPQIPKASN